jgi:hypothetical protein
VWQDSPATSRAFGLRVRKAPGLKKRLGTVYHPPAPESKDMSVSLASLESSSTCYTRYRTLKDLGELMHPFNGHLEVLGKGILKLAGTQRVVSSS